MPPLDEPHEGKDPQNGRFIPGNRFWEARSSHGASPKFETADALRDACTQYFEWVEANPLEEEKVFNGKDGIVRATVAKMRAMTIAGLCNFIDVRTSTWHEWKASRPDLSDVITRTESMIYQQKFEGASADLLNANIIARDLGLADKQEVEHKNPDPGELNARLGELLSRCLISRTTTSIG